MSSSDVSGNADTVVVYAYRHFDGQAGEMMVSPHKAPRHLITSRFAGEVLEGTAEVVSPSELGSDGCYRRVATGWGALN